MKKNKNVDILNKFFTYATRFLIGGDGTIYEARGWNAVGAHTYGWNNKSVGIAFIGTYESEFSIILNV